MPIDTSIYNLIQQPKPIQAGPMPFEQAGQMMQIKHMIDQGQLAGLQRGELERGIADKGRLRDLFARGNVKPEEVMAIDTTTGLSYQKSVLENQKSEADLAKTRAETISKNMGILRDLAAQATDDAGFRVLKEATHRFFGPEQAARIPDRFDHEVQKRMVMTADQVLERLSPKLNMTDTGAAQQPTNPYTGAPQGAPIAKTASPESRLSADTTRRGQDMTDRRERDVDFQSRLTAAKTAAQERAKNSVEAQAALPGIIQKANEGLALIDQMIGTKGLKLQPGQKEVAPHPGFQSFVGATLAPGLRFVEGTDTAGFGALYEQIKGKAFLEAFESIKGGGHITEIEGQKATQAITRMNKAQNESEFIAAAREFQQNVRNGMAKAKAKAGQQPAPAAAPAQPIPAGSPSRGATGSWGASPAAGGIKFLGFE